MILRDNDIIKALEQCSLGECVGCPFAKGCITELTHDAKDLITRQRAEIERLEEENIHLLKLICKKFCKKGVKSEKAEF